jgi:CRP/FNR family transcriptional regulator
MDNELQGAVRVSFLAELPADAISALVDGAVRVELPAGAWLCGPDTRSSVKLVVQGLLRIVRIVADGRTITQRYLRRGDVAGIALPFTDVAGGPSAQCVTLTHSVYYEFRNENWRLTAERDGRVAVALLKDLSRVAELNIEHMANRALASMRQRVVGQLLDAAEGPDSIASITQQQLADGVGSAREVVARVLHELREERLVATRTGSVVLLDPERLRLELQAS